MNSFISFYLNYSTYIYNFLQLKILSLDKLRIYLFNLIFQFCFRINIFYYSARFYCNKFNTIFDNFIWNFLLFSNFSTVVNKNKIYYLYYQLIYYLKKKERMNWNEKQRGEYSVRKVRTEIAATNEAQLWIVVLQCRAALYVKHISER